MYFLVIYPLICVVILLSLLMWHTGTGKGTSDWYGKKRDEEE